MANNSIIEILSNCILGKYVIPIFQRRYDWKDDQVIELIASTFFEIIPGSFLVFKASNKDFSYTQIGKKTVYDSNCINENYMYVIDGQQRITSYLLAFTDYFHKLDDSIFGANPKKFYLELDPSDHLFGFKNLIFEEPNLSNYDYDSFCNRIVSVNYKSNPVQNNSGSYYLDLSLFINSFGNLLNRDYRSLTSNIERIARNRASDLFNYIIDNKDNIIKLQKELDSKYLGLESEELKNKLDAEANNWTNTLFNYITHKMMHRELNFVEIPNKNLEFVLKSYQIMNTTGKSLDVLDILASKFAAVNDAEKLYDRINSNMSKIIDVQKYDKFGIIRSSEIDGLKIKWNFMQYLVENSKTSKKIDTPTKVTDQIIKMIKFISLCKNESIRNTINSDLMYRIQSYSSTELLNLTPDEINSYIDEACDCVSKAGALLQLLGGLRSISDLVHFWKLFVLAALLYYYPDLSINQVNIVYNWYWVSRFMGRYRIDQNTTALNDLYKLVSHIPAEKKISFVVNNSLREMISQSKGLLDESIMLNNNEINDPFQLQKQFLCEYGIKQGYTLINEIDGFKFISVLTQALTKNPKFSLEMDHFFPIKGHYSLADCSQFRKNKKHMINAPLNFTFLTNHENKNITNLQPKEYRKIITNDFFLKNFIPESIFSDNIELIDALKSRYNEFKRIISSEFDMN